MPTRIVFLILPNTHLMDLAGPDQVFLEAIGYGADFTLDYCSYAPELTTSAGLPLGKVKHFTDIALEKGDYLMVPGADVHFILHNPSLRAQTALFEWVRSAHARRVNIGSVCTGSFFLAICGILDGKPATTHWKRIHELQVHFPKVKVVENVLFTEQDGIYTSAGVAAGIDMALYIVEQLKGAFFAHKIARELVIYIRRGGSESQHSIFLDYRNHIHAGIHAVQDWLQEHLQEKTNLAALAEIACMSERNFTRVFKKEIGLTVNAYLLLLRKAKIKELRQNRDLSLRQIASACGLESERQVSRIIKSEG